MSDGQLPVAIEAERLALGCIIAFPDCAPDVFGKLHARDFVDSARRAVYEKMLDQHGRGLAVDPPLLGMELKTHPEFADGSAAGFLLELGESVATVEHAGYYCQQVLEASHKRRLLQYGESVIEGAMNGKPASEMLRTATAELDDLQREFEAGQPTNKFAFADLRSQFPRLNPPVIDGLARQGETINIVSTSKAGKSWLAYYILLCIVTGRDVFNRFATSAGKVLLVDNELHKPTVANRIPAVAAAMQTYPDEYERELDVWALRGNLCTMAELADDLYRVEPGKYRAIIFDAKYRLSPPGASENDNSSETQFYNLLDRIGEHTQAALMLIHHSSKGDQGSKRVTDVGAGAGAQSRAADCHLVLREHEEPDVAVLEAAVRSFAPVEPLALQWQFPLWVPIAGVDTTKLRGKQTAGQQRQTQDDREGREATRKALADGPLSGRQIRRRTGMGEHRQSRLIDQLSALNEITSTTQQNGAATYEIYQLKG